MRRLTISYLVIGAFLPLLSGCSAWSMAIGGGATAATAAKEERGFGQTVNDNGIMLEIVNSMLNTDAGMLRKVDVEVHEGRVLLAGRVDKPEMRVTAVRIAWQQPNVVEVIDRIEVAEPETIGEYAHDVWLAQELRTTLLIDNHVRSINYNVDCVAGTIYLMGVAQDQVELQRVIDHARDISYVRNVVSFVRLKNDPARLQSPATVQSSAGQTTVTQPAAATP